MIMKSKITLILLLLFITAGSLFGQVQINAPLSYQPVSLEQGGAPGIFKVDIVNNNTSVLSGSTLSLVLPVGVEYVTGSVTAATQLNISNLQSPTFTLNNIPVGNTLTVTFNARINCGYTAAQIGYSVLSGSTTLATGSSAVAANTPTPAYVLTEVPTPQVLSTAIKTDASRTIKFKNSGSIAVNTVYIESVVSTAAQSSSYKIMSANNGTVSTVTNGYRVTLTGAALQNAITTSVGAANTSFDPGEEITIVLTEQMLSCATGTTIALNMKAGSGDSKGSFCFSDGSTAAISSIVGNPSINFNRIVANSTYPTFCADGTTSYTIANLGSGGKESALYNIKLPWSTNRAASGSIALAPSDGLILKKISIGGVDVTAQVLTMNGTGSSALISGAQNVNVINLAALTSALGGVALADLDGDGHYDDLMPGQSFQIDFVYGFDLSKFQSCLLQSALLPNDNNGFFNLGTAFKDQCGNVINKFDYSVGVISTGTNQGFQVSTQGADGKSATIAKALFNVGDKSSITVTLSPNITGALYSTAIAITKVFSIIMPDGLDYDPTGVLKYGGTTLPASVTSYSGKTLTITLSSVAYSGIRGNDAILIPIIASDNTAVNKTITFKATYSQNSCPGSARDYGCGSTLLNYGFVTNCPIINTVSFNAVRATFGFVADVSGINVFYRPR